VRRRQLRPEDKWHLDEVFIKINGVQRYLWRTVDADGAVLDILVQNRRDKAAARRFFHKLRKTTASVPRMVVTDKLRSYGAAHCEVMPPVEHRQSRYVNNPSGELSSADQTAGANDEGLPIGGISATFPGLVQSDLSALPTTPPHDACPYRSRYHEGPHHLEPDHRLGSNGRSDRQLF
jgi:IS1 family transposase